jgi:hypothetical protein
MARGFPFRGLVYAIVCAVAALFPGAWSGTAWAIYVRTDLAEVGLPGVGLDDYEAVGSAYPATGYIWNTSSLPGRGQFCTGTIIGYVGDTARILTAAHCIFGENLTDLSFQLGNNGNLNGAGYSVIAGWFPATYTFTGPRADDVGILAIQATQAQLGGVAAAAYSYQTPSDLLGNQFDMVGWGNQGTGTAQGVAAPPRGRAVTDSFGYTAKAKLGAQNIVDAVYNGYLVGDFDDPGNADGINPTGSAFPLSLEGMIGRGDSGGPMVPVGLAPGAGTIVAVASGASFVAAKDCRAQDTSLYNTCGAWAPLSANRAFIDYYATVEIPEPATILLVGLLLVVFQFSRRLRARRS